MHGRLRSYPTPTFSSPSPRAAQTALSSCPAWDAAQKTSPPVTRSTAQTHFPPPSQTATSRPSHGRTPTTSPQSPPSAGQTSTRAPSRTYSNSSRRRGPTIASRDPPSPRMTSGWSAPEWCHQRWAGLESAAILLPTRAGNFLLTQMSAQRPYGHAQGGLLSPLPLAVQAGWPTASS